MYNNLNTKVNNLENRIPDTTTLIYINRYNTKKQSLEKETRNVDKKVLDVSALVTATLLYTKIGGIKNRTPDTSGLVTITVFNTKIGEAENKIPDVSVLVKKMDYNTKVSDIEGKYFSTPDNNKFTRKIFETKIKEKGLVDKSSISNLLKNSDLNTNFSYKSRIKGRARQNSET